MAQATITLSSKCPRIYVAIGAACWASYLINGDASGISNDERALADAWCERDPVRLHDEALQRLLPATTWREAS